MNGLLVKQKDQMMPRSTLLWLIIGYLLTLIPHFLLYLPLWILPITLLCFVWRYRIYTMKANYPSAIIKLGLLALLLGGLYFLHGNFFDSLGFSILFMALFSLKFIESKTVRDAKVLIFLSYFALGIGFIFNNSIFMALYSLIPFIIITMALLGLQQAGFETYKNRFMLREVSKLLLLSFPFMVVLFLFFPRFPSMLSLNREDLTNQASTGINDEMNPGDISNLVESDELIFWADFKADMLTKPQLYWRVLTLDQFDGKRWSRSRFLKRSERPPRPTMNRRFAIPYAIYMEPTQEKYLASLDVSEQQNPTDRYDFYYDYRIENPYPITSKIRYDLIAYPQSKMDNELELGRSRFLRWLSRYPHESNPKTQAWVAEHLTGKSVEETIQYLQEYIHNGDYWYTLTPQRLGDNLVDDFFLGTKKGFCEHYAASVAYILRIADIPARIVVGYQGGAVDYANQRVQVRGSNAHAWIEYWAEGNGWTRFDPSVSIHPTRIEESTTEAINRREGLLKGTFFDKVSMKLTSYKERMEYYWTKFIVGYNSATYLESMQEWLQTAPIKRIVTVVLSIVGSITLLTVIVFTRPWRYFIFNSRRIYYRLMAYLERRYHIDFPYSIAPREILPLLEGEISHEDAIVLQKALANIEEYLYNPSPRDKKVLQREIRRSVRRVMR